MTQATLAELLRVLRARRGLTVAEAATRMGIQRHTLRDLELGRRTPTIPTLHKIAEGYGISVEELLEEPAPKARTTPTLEEVLQEGVGTHYLAMPHEDLEDMYEDASFEEARALTRQILAEQKFINNFLKEHNRAEISGHWITASQLNRWVSLEGMQRAAQREIDQAREAGNEARAEEIREGYGLAVQETVGVF